jgi:Na+/melibiose symporter-like transporter
MATESSDSDSRPLPKAEFWAYSVGYTGPMTVMSLVNVLLVNYYTFIIGLNSLYSALSLTFGLVLLSFFSLYFGNASDNASGSLAQKYGKRRPYIFFSMIPMAITFVLMWFPPSKPTAFGGLDWSATIWLWVNAAIFDISLAAFSTLYGSMLPEISHSAEERMHISIVQNLMNLIATIISIIVPIIFLSGVSSWQNVGQSLWYGSGTGSAGLGIIFQMIFYSVAFAILTVISVTLMVKIVQEPGVTGNGTQKKSFFQVIKETAGPLRQRNYGLFMGATFAFYVTMRILMTDILIFVGVVLNLQGYEWFVFGGVAAACGVGAFVGWDKIHNKWGLKRAFELVLGVTTIILFVATIFLFNMPHLLDFIIGIILVSAGVAALVGILIFPMPIFAALVDEEKVKLPPEEGAKLAGKYNGVNTFFTNISQAIANLLYGLVLSWLGQSNPVAIVIVLPISGIFIAVAFLIFRKIEL